MIVNFLKVNLNICCKQMLCPVINKHHRPTTSQVDKYIYQSVAVHLFGETLHILFGGGGRGGK